MEVKVILETVSCLVSVWKTGIEWSRSVVLDLVVNNISHLQSEIVGLLRCPYRLEGGGALRHSKLSIFCVLL